MFVFLFMFLMYKCMTNKSYFYSLFDSPLYLGDFLIKFRFRVKLDKSVYGISPKEHRFTFEVFTLDGKFVGLYGNVALTRRCIHTDIFYSDVNLCKFSPYELREWCPAIFLPWTNYLHWRKYLRIALEIFVESNPRLHVLFE